MPAKVRVTQRNKKRPCTESNAVKQANQESKSECAASKMTKVADVFKPWTTGSDPKLSKCQQQLYVSHAKQAIEILKHKFVLRLANAETQIPNLEILSSVDPKTQDRKQICWKLEVGLVPLQFICACWTDIVEHLSQEVIRQCCHLYSAEHDAWTRILMEFQLELERLWNTHVCDLKKFCLVLLECRCSKHQYDCPSGKLCTYDFDVSSGFAPDSNNSSSSISKFSTIPKSNDAVKSLPIVRFVQQFIEAARIWFVPIVSETETTFVNNNDNVDEYGLFTPTGLQSVIKQSIVWVHGHYASACDSKFYCSHCHESIYISISTGQTRSADEGFTAWFVCTNPSHGKILLKRK